MSESLSVFLALSIAGSGVIVFSCFIKWISKEIFAAKWHYWNRKLALFLFLIPVFWISELTFVVEKENRSNSFWYSTIIYENTLSLTELFVQIVFVVWLIGVIATGLWFLYLYRDFFKKLQVNCVTVPKEHELWSILERQRSDMNLKGTINLAYCQANISPILVGVFKPTIVLPMYDIPNDELDMIIRHELTHYKKKDLWIKRAMLLATILHWYNPFIYVLQREINKWCELACDEDIVIEMSHAERKKYGETILNMVQRATQDSRVKQNSNTTFLSTSFSNGRTHLKRRLINMLKVKKVSKPIVVLSAVMLLALGSISIVSSAFAHKNFPSFSEKTTLHLGEQPTENSNGQYSLYSVKLSDESKFRKGDWAEILKQIESGEVILEKE